MRHPRMPPGPEIEGADQDPALRILHGLPRFSEDLDFICIQVHSC